MNRSSTTLKSHDSIVGVLAGRVAALLLPAATRRGYTPNQITLASLGLVLVAAPLAAFGGSRSWIVAALLVASAFVLDCLDGQLARATDKASDFGRYLDSLTDLAKVFVLISALTVNLSRHGLGLVAWPIGGLALFGYLLCEYHTQVVRQFPQRPQEDYERTAAPWKARLAIGGQRIDLAYAIGEVMLTIAIALLFGRIRDGLLVILLATPIQFVSYFVRFWRHRYAP